MRSSGSNKRTWIRVELREEAIIPFDHPWPKLDDESATILILHCAIGLSLPGISPLMYKNGDRRGAQARVTKKYHEGLRIVLEAGKIDLSAFKPTIRSIWAAAYESNPKAEVTIEPKVFVLTLPEELLAGKNRSARGAYHRTMLKPQFCDGVGAEAGLDDETFHIVRLFLEGSKRTEIARQLYDGVSTTGARLLRINKRLRPALNLILNGAVRALLQAPAKQEGEGGEQPAEAAYSPNALAGGGPPKSCPRCNGSMLFEEDWHGAYSTCLSCGYVYEFGVTAASVLNEQGGEHHQRRRHPSHAGRPI